MSAYDYSIYYRNWHDESPEHHAQMSQWKATQLQPLLTLPKDARILDVGCGFGFALGGLRKLGYSNVVGVEQSSQQAAVCRDAGFNVSVTSDTVAWLKEQANQYDGILLFDVLEHLPVDVQIDFVRAIHTALKAGGEFILTVPNANAILAARWRYNDYTHFSSFTEFSLAFVLKNAGFVQLWIDNSKGLGSFPRRVWRRKNWPALRKWLVRWCWLQVFKAEQPQEPIENICFELNLTARATKTA